MTFGVAVTEAEVAEATAKAQEEKAKAEEAKRLLEEQERLVKEKEKELIKQKEEQLEICNIVDAPEAQSKKRRHKNVAYKIECSTCHMKYIGEISQKMSQRRKQHESDVRRKVKTNDICTVISNSIKIMLFTGETRKP